MARSVLHDAVRHVRGSDRLRRAARAGLVARAVFYLLLAYLAARVALVGGAHGPQANANGALRLVAREPLGVVALAASALGFAVYGVVRIVGAIGDHAAGGWRRLGTAGQGVLYLALAAGTASFVLGRHATGSEQQQRQTTAAVLGWPFGRELVGAAGVSLLVVCAWQVRVAVRGHYLDGLELQRAPAPLRRVAVVLGRIGIPARAATLAPIGGLLLAAAVRADPNQAKGLDAVTLEVAETWWGTALLLLVAAGFVAFAAYSVVEAAYRRVAAGV